MNRRLGSRQPSAEAAAGTAKSAFADLCRKARGHILLAHATPARAGGLRTLSRDFSRRLSFALVAVGLLVLATPVRAEAPAPAAPGTVRAGDPELWGVAGPSPYYPGDGLQSPLRDDGVHVGGDIWIDSGYEQSNRGLESEPDQRFWLQQGRFMLDVTGTYTWHRFFAQAKGQLLAHVEEVPGDEYIDTDDAWIRLGQWDLWDLQFGRFEGWEVYHKGEGLERDTLEDKGAFDGPDIYEVNYAFYRQNGFGQFAAHVYPLSWLRFEVGTVFGNELGFNSWGVRPVGIVDLGWLKLKLAGEYRKLNNQEVGKKQWEEKRGFGGGLIFHFADLNSVVTLLRFGANGAFGLVDKVDAFGKVDERGSPDTLSVGGFVNVGLWAATLGLGYNRTFQGDRQYNDQTDREGYFVHDQAFASVRHPIVFSWLWAKLVVAYARGDLRPAFENARVNDMISVRLRLSMTF